MHHQLYHTLANNSIAFSLINNKQRRDTPLPYSPKKAICIGLSSYLAFCHSPAVLPHLASEAACVEVSLNDEIHVSFDCRKCNASVRLDEPSDIAYLTRLAREEPGAEAKLASRDGGLQGYVEAMVEFN